MSMEEFPFLRRGKDEAKAKHDLREIHEHDAAGGHLATYICSCGGEGTERLDIVVCTFT